MTAAPGPQQPDEGVVPTVRALAAYSDGTWCGECRFEVVEDPPCCFHPAAPSAQPDEDRCAPACTWAHGLYWHDPECPCWRRGRTFCACANPTPAQPVRDTEEGRR